MHEVSVLKMAFVLCGMAVMSPAVAATASVVPPPAAAPTLSQTRGLSCTAGDRLVRDIVIDFTAGRWRESGHGWTRIVAQDDATITLVRKGEGMLGGILSGARRLETLDRATLVLSTRLQSGLIDEVRSYRCKVVEPFDAKRQM